MAKNLVSLCLEFPCQTNIYGITKVFLNLD